MHTGCSEHRLRFERGLRAAWKTDFDVNRCHRDTGTPAVAQTVSSGAGAKVYEPRNGQRPKHRHHTLIIGDQHPLPARWQINVIQGSTGYSCPSAVRIANGENGANAKCLRMSVIMLQDRTPCRRFHRLENSLPVSADLPSGQGLVPQHPGTALLFGGLKDRLVAFLFVRAAAGTAAAPCAHTRLVPAALIARCGHAPHWTHRRQPRSRIGTRSQFITHGARSCFVALFHRPDLCERTAKITVVFVKRHKVGGRVPGARPGHAVWNGFSSPRPSLCLRAPRSLDHRRWV